MKIQVTMEDITKGTVDPCHCPVARALSRHFNYAGVWEDAEGYDGYELVLAVEEKSPTITIPAPDEVKAFVNNYDDGKAVVPFEFDLEIEKYT